jgi:hypothetical protein
VPRDRHGNVGATEAVVRVDLQEAGQTQPRACPGGPATCVCATCVCATCTIVPRDRHGNVGATEAVVRVDPGGGADPAARLPGGPATCVCATCVCATCTIVPQDRHGNVGATEAVVRVDLQEAGQTQPRACQVGLPPVSVPPVSVPPVSVPPVPVPPVSVLPVSVPKNPRRDRDPLGGSTGIITALGKPVPRGRSLRIEKVTPKGGLG